METDFSNWRNWEDELAQVSGQICNPNLLINWDFRNPINQRGKKEYNIYGYCLDRWIYYGEKGQALKIEDDHIVIDGNAVEYTSGIFQTPEFPSTYSGKIVTFSVKYRGDGGTIRCYSRELAKELGGKSMSKVNDWSIAFVAFEIPQLTDDTKRLEFQINTISTKELQIQSAKVEIGIRSTLQMDEKADYGEQLALCQRYFLRFNGDSSHAILGHGTKRGIKDIISFQVPTPVTMRVAPKISFQNIKVYGDGPVITEISSPVLKLNSVYFNAKYPHDGLEYSHNLAVFIEDGGFFELDAEL